MESEGPVTEAIEGRAAHRSRWWSASSVVMILLASAAPGHAQEPPPTTDSLAVAGADTLLAAVGDTVPMSRADSTRLQILNRLTRLARPVGVDSLELRAMEDSLALIDQAGRPGGAGRGQGGGRPSTGGDSIAAALLSLPGYSITEYTGGGAHLDSDRTLVLNGAEGSQAAILRPEGEIRSDTVVYDPRSQRMRTEGGEAVLIPSQGDELVSERLIFDTQEQRGTALGATTTYSQGGEWTVRGDLPSVNSEVVYGSHAQFTSCQEEEPHYHFQAGEVKIHGGNWLVARPVTLYFGDVPVAWLPFIAQGLGDGRTSGLLTPRFSVNDVVRNDTGYNRRISNVGFYWATSEYMDVALGMDWWDNNYTALTGTFRYNWQKQFLAGGLNYRQFWRTEGTQELAFDTQHSWQPDERTRLSISARYSSNNDFVRENSFDPREVTQSIDSNGGVSRRFDWGTTTLGVNRRQFLSDDRIETTLPTANLSLSPMSFFEAPPNRANWYNNLTWSGGGSFNRSTLDLADVPDSIVAAENLVDQLNQRTSANSSFNLGAFSWTQAFGLTEQTYKDVQVIEPVVADSTTAQSLLTPIQYGRRSQGVFDDESAFRDLSRADMNWSMSVDYQQRLIGSTTLTPAIAFSGMAQRSDALADSVPEASGFVSAPVRISAGAQLKTDVYGFWPGFASFEAVRHKFSPSFTWAYTPSSTPTDLQRQVFNVGELTTRNELRIGLNQTFEAKRTPKDPEEELAAAGALDSLALADTLAVTDSLLVDSLSLAEETLPGTDPVDPLAPRPMEQSGVVKLLAINTSAVTYDFVRADSLGSWDQGFETTRISNQFSSDFLRGFTVSVDHDLFDDIKDEEGITVDREFDLHLSQLNVGFSLGSNSGIFRFLRGTESDDEPEEPNLEDEDPFAVRSGTDEATMIPGRPGSATTARDQQRGSAGAVGGWNANIQYSLARPRDDAFAPKNQMVQWTLTFKPTRNWDVSWRTSYDLERDQFNDHMIRLSRDLHRWEANFDFRQTVTGNWTFLFSVALIDNRDLKLDYNQRELDSF